MRIRQAACAAFDRKQGKAEIYISTRRACMNRVLQ